MTPRKETPDLLAEMLGAKSPDGNEVNLEQVAPQKPARTPKRKPRKSRSQKIEIIIVTFQDYRGLRPR